MESKNKTGLERPAKIPMPSAVAGAALLWPSGDAGWSHPPLLLPTPLLVLRVNSRGTEVMTPEGEIIAASEDNVFTPFRWIDELLTAIRMNSAGTERKLFTAPAFPVATFIASYEFGRFFHPHENCFPYASQCEVDDLVVGVHATGFVLRKGRWEVVGRPPLPKALWGDWVVPERACEWPRPPVFLKCNASTEEDSWGAELMVAEDIDLPEPPVSAAMPPSRYNSAVQRIHHYLESGDIYQANLTARFEGRTTVRPERLFLEGLRAGGDRFAALAYGQDCAHVSFSPELLVRKWGRNLTTRPIKGTRPRPDEEKLHIVSRDLALSEKDRAEHVMIVDLERNDLGRLCEYGSIRVDPLMEVTTHPTVLHMESTVTGTARSTVGLRDIMAAIFPGGSVTGAPKKRAMEIIGELENRPRGIYCGAMGWVDFRGDCELNLPIRTATVHGDGRLRMHAGGGIVADSTASGEWDEMQHKLAFLKNALSAAQA